MEPLEEILQTVRELRAAQLEALAWRKRYVRNVLVSAGVILALIFAWMAFTSITIK